MIRMGRSSRGDAAEAANDYPQPGISEQPSRYAAEPQASGTKAISESDSMARDIKEGRLSGFVGHGTTLTGETQFQAMLRVDGHLVGTVTSDSGTLIVGTNGLVDANVAVAAAMINGSVNGDILATEKLQLGRTARVMGNIQAPRLIIEEGAILEGGCSMLRAMENSEAATAQGEEEEEEEDEAPPYSSSTSYGSSADDGQASLLDDADDDETVAGTASA